MRNHYRKAPLGNPLLRAIRAVTASLVTLNDGPEQPRYSPDALGAELMMCIRGMRDEFYDTRRGVVDYDALRGSTAFAHYRVLTNGLRRFDLNTLKSDEERLAFWINLYNTIVVDGIVTLRVKESVREIPGFFRRIRYDIGGLTFSPDQMEHGLLRGNARPWGRPFRPFHWLNPRRKWIIGRCDPRIHFSLVCGSRSCAPIEYYDHGRLDVQLEAGARSFVNSSEVLVLPEQDRILLSEIFRWYKTDFGGKAGVIDFICRYLAADDLRHYLKANGERLTFEYLFYDWNLNMGGN